MAEDVTGTSRLIAVSSILDFSQLLLGKLQSLSQGTVLPVDESVLVHKHLQQINLELVPDGEETRELDNIAIKLWNTTVYYQDPIAKKKMVCLVQAYAAMLLVICQNGMRNDRTNLLRVLKTCLRAARSCLENEHTSLSRIILDKCAGYEAFLRGQRSPYSVSSKEFNHYVQYQIQRLHLAIKENRIDEINMFVGNLEKNLGSLDRPSWNYFLGLLIQVGQSFIRETEYKKAYSWLSRAHNSMTMQRMDDAWEAEPTLRLQVLQGLLQLPSNTIGLPGKKLIEELSVILENTQAHTMPYRLTVLEHCARDENLSNTTLQIQFNMSLRHFTQRTSLSQSTFDTILYYINKQFSVAPIQAFSILKGDLIHRLVDEQNQGWIEKIVIMMVYFQGKMAASGPSGVQNDLETILTECWEKFGDCISTLGANACLMGISMGLQKAERDSNNVDQVALLQWCRIGLHKIFHQMQDVNRAKLQRKLMQYWIEKEMPQKVNEIYDSMSQDMQKSTESQFLLYRCSVRLGSIDMAKKALHGILMINPNDLETLSACIEEARSSKANSYKTLLSVLEVILLETRSSTALYPPSMYRLALKLSGESENGTALLAPKESMLWICGLLEKASRTMLDAASVAQWTSIELEWFYTQSWNLTLDHMNDWPAARVLNLAKVSATFIEQLMRRLPVDSVLPKRYLLAIFLECALNLTRARQALIQQEKDVFFEAVKFKSGEFVDQARELENVLTEQDAREMKGRCLAVLTFQLEAAIKTQDWPRAEQVLQYTGRSNGQHLDYHNQAILGDIVLSADAPSEVKFNLLEGIIHNCYTLTNDVQKLSRWIRCLFSLTVDKEPSRAVNCLEQACSLAQQFPGQYPDEELRWLAIHAYNTAVEFYSSGQDIQWSTWAKLALRLAQVVGDAALQDRISQTISETQT